MQLPELGSHVGREHPCGESLLRKRTERKRRERKKGGKRWKTQEDQKQCSKQLAVGDGCCTGNRNPLTGKLR